MTHEERMSFMRSIGCKYLGSGSTATVFEIPWAPDKVIKCGRRDDGWLGYCTWAEREGYAGTFAPKLFSYKQDKEGSYVALMERLQESYKHNQPGKEKELDNIILTAGRLFAPQFYNRKPVPTEYTPFIERLYRLVKTNGGFEDVSRSNIMWRASNNMLVFTDPAVIKGLNAHSVSKRSPRMRQASPAFKFDWNDPIV